MSTLVHGWCGDLPKHFSTSNSFSIARGKPLGDRVIVSWVQGVMCDCGTGPMDGGKSEIQNHLFSRTITLLPGYSHSVTLWLRDLHTQNLNSYRGWLC